MSAIQDIMTQKPVQIQTATEIKEALVIFSKNMITSAPVVSPMGEICGLLTDMILIKIFLAVNGKPGKHQIAQHLAALEKPVMVSEEDTVPNLLKAFFQAPSHRVLVLDQKQKICGIVSPHDLYPVLLGQKEKTETLKHQYETAQKQLIEITEALAKSEESLQTYKAAFDYAPYLIHSVDKEGKILNANRAFHIALGYEPGALIGKSIFDIYPTSSHRDIKKGLEKIDAVGFHESINTSMVNKDGGMIRIDLVSGSIRDKHGLFKGTLTVSRLVDSEGATALLSKIQGVIAKEKMI